MGAIIPILTTVGIAVARSVAGWLENALEDRRIDSYEWGILGATIVRVSIVTLGLSFGLDMTAVAAGSSAVVLDYIVSKLRG